MRRVLYVGCFVALFGTSINAQDAINLGDVEMCGAPDVRGWPATATITKLIVQPTDTFIEHTKTPDGWPEMTPPGWDDPLQYTLWPVYKVNGRWVATGAIQFWRFRNGTGSPLHSIAADWVPPSCGEMKGHQPSPGEQIGFFVTAGNQRIVDQHAVAERSNVVLITYPAGENQVFTFAAVPPTPQQPPKFEPLPPIVVSPPVVPPPSVPPPPPPTDSGYQLAAKLEQLAQQLALHEAQSATRQQELKAAIDNPGYVMRILGNRYVQLALAGIGTYVTTRQMVQP
jgi:hypothetical protein